VDLRANVYPNVYPRLPEKVKWVNKMAILGKHVGKQIAESIVNKRNIEDLNEKL
jgi:hypothetical protein